MGCCSSGLAAVVPHSDPRLQGKLGDEDIRDKYDIGTLLGSGSFGQVREAAMKDPPFCVRAVKMIERRDNEDGEWSSAAMFVREVNLLQDMDHENIIKYFDVYEDIHFLYVVMELCRGGEVFSKIIELKRFSEHHAAELGGQMLRAIDHIHTLRIVHRDIKAENFMLAEPAWPSTVKMIDFGMACRCEEGQVLTELCGSPHYLAPELIAQRYNHRVDVWSFGVLLYLLMYGQYPYDAKASKDVMVKIITEPIQWQTRVKLNPHTLSFLKRVLEHNPKKRMMADEALRHQWIMSQGVVSDSELEALPSEVVRDAHRKATTNRKQVDPKVEEQRNQKLQKIDEDYHKGIRVGKCLAKTELQAYMTKPEFLRRENKLSTSPSEQLSCRRISVDRLLATRGFAAGRRTSQCSTKSNTSTPPPPTELLEASRYEPAEGDRIRQRSVTMGPRCVTPLECKADPAQDVRATFLAVETFSDNFEERLPEFMGKNLRVSTASLNSEKQATDFTKIVPQVP